MTDIKNPDVGGEVCSQVHVARAANSVNSSISSKKTRSETKMQFNCREAFHIFPLISKNYFKCFLYKTLDINMNEE